MAMVGIAITFMSAVIDKGGIMQLRVEGTFPKSLVPTIIKVEPEKGTFGLYKDKDTLIASGQLYGDKKGSNG